MTGEPFCGSRWEVCPDLTLKDRMGEVGQIIWGEIYLVPTLCHISMALSQSDLTRKPWHPRRFLLLFQSVFRGRRTWSYSWSLLSTGARWFPKRLDYVCIKVTWYHMFIQRLDLPKELNLEVGHRNLHLDELPKWFIWTQDRRTTWLNLNFQNSKVLQEPNDTSFFFSNRKSPSFTENYSVESKKWNKFTQQHASLSQHQQVANRPWYSIQGHSSESVLWSIITLRPKVQSKLKAAAYQSQKHWVVSGFIDGTHILYTITLEDILLQSVIPKLWPLSPSSGPNCHSVHRRDSMSAFLFRGHFLLVSGRDAPA